MGKLSGGRPQFGCLVDKGEYLQEVLKHGKLLVGLGALHQFGKDDAAADNLLVIHQPADDVVIWFVLAEELNPDRAIDQHPSQDGCLHDAARRLWR